MPRKLEQSVDPSTDPRRAPAADRFATRAISAPLPSFPGRDLHAGDPPLRAAVEPFSDPGLDADLAAAGSWAGSAEAAEFARLANRFPPAPGCDPDGQPVEEVDCHPAFHALMRRSIAMGLSSSLWEERPEEAGRRHGARAARLYLSAQADLGHLGIVSATSAAVPVLSARRDVLDGWLPLLSGRRYDHRALPVTAKVGATLGLGIAERRGGSDPEAVDTIAVPLGDGACHLTGTKAFISHPGADAFLMLARAPGGPSMFFVPRFRADGSPNALHVRRLKPLLGLRSAPVAEIALADADGWLIGSEGEGARFLTEIATLTRLDGALMAAGAMRVALARAVHHARHRRVSGGLLIEQPLMRRVLADMAVDVAAATMLVMRLARAFDRAAEDPDEAAFARLMTPAVKFWVSRAAPALIAEALDCVGGSAFVEPHPLARLQADAPGLSLWDGSGNALALDVARLAKRSPATFEAVRGLFARDLGKDADVPLDDIRAAASASAADPGTARILTEQVALVAAAAALARSAPRALTDAFLATRLAGLWRTSYGMLDQRHDARGIIDYVCPAM